MIAFISGRAASGKTYEVYNRIKGLVSNKENAVLIVPEQFSFESEKAMLNLVGEVGLRYISVLPFSRLYETIGRITGGICGKVLTNADKHIIMIRAITAVQSELTLWGKYANSAAFAGEIIKSIDEFKFSAVNSDDLRVAADGVKDLKLKSKLKDTALIFDSYEMLLGTSFIDPSDYMDKLYNMLSDCRFFEDKNVFFDGFKSFSGQQFKIVDRIISSAKNVTFTFIDDPNDGRTYSLFSNVRKTKNRIEKILSSHNLSVSDNIYLNRNNYANNDLKVLENALYTGVFDNKECKTAITVCEAETIYDETEFVARTIRQIVKDEGASFSDFVIIARDTDTYEDALQIACKRNNVNVFIDKKVPLSAMPISSLITAAVEFTKKPTLKTVFNFYKSGIAGLKIDEISELERYSYIWKLKPADFEKEWDMNPDGFTDRVPEDVGEKLDNINNLRKKAIKPLLNFKAKFDGTAKQRAKAIFDLLDDIDARQSLYNLTEYYKQCGELEYARILKQSYSQFVSLIDNIVVCFPDNYVSKSIFFDAIKTVLSFNSVGVAPQTLDEAVFGSAERIRPARPKYSFILGVNQGVFPKINPAGGLFTNNDLTALKQTGLDINDRAVDFAIDEQLLFYTNICCATNKVHISYSKLLPDNSQGLPSRYVSLIDKLNVRVKKEPDALSEDNLPQTVSAARVEYYNRLNDGTADAVTILEALKNENGDIPNFIKEFNISAEKAKLSEGLAKQLYGSEVYLSATKLETYSFCKFKYFCRFVAKAQSYERADISPLQRGNIVHFVLQKIVEEYKENIAALTPNEIDTAVDKCCSQYLDGIPGYSTFENARVKYLIYTVSRTLKDVVKRLAAEFAQSEFKPVGCEVKIGNNSPVSVKLKIDQDCNIVLSGSVDRIDQFGEYVRVVDYKTSAKDFYLPEILSGINMQMLIYLYAVNNSESYGSKPAAVLYSFAMRNKHKKATYDGLLVDDEDVVNAMEEANMGEFVPKFGNNRTKHKFISQDDFTLVLDYVNKKLKKVGQDILSGDISAIPVDSKNGSPCEYCEFATVCRINDDVRKKVEDLTNDEVIERIKDGEENGR